MKYIFLFLIVLSLSLWLAAIIDVAFNFGKHSHRNSNRFFFLSVPIIGPAFYFYDKYGSKKQ